MFRRDGSSLFLDDLIHVGLDGLLDVVGKLVRYDIQMEITWVMVSSVRTMGEF